MNPTITVVNGDHIIEFVYGVEDPANAGTELKHTITENYVDQSGKVIAAATTTLVPTTTAYEKTSSLFAGYKYVGFTVDGGALQSGTPRFDHVTADHSINFVYEADGKSESNKPEQGNNNGGNESNLPNTAMAENSLLGSFVLIVAGAFIALVSKTNKKEDDLA